MVQMKIASIGRNKTEVIINGFCILVSYEKPVAAILHGVPCRINKIQSKTTENHIRIWLKSKGYETAVNNPESFFDRLVDTEYLSSIKTS